MKYGLMNQWSPRPELNLPSGDASGSVEAIDHQILLLLSQRLTITREDGDGVWHEGEQRRSAISAIRRRAFELGVPVGLVADFWDRLADASAAMRNQVVSQQRAIND